jgi:hypothetical protein
MKRIPLTQGQYALVDNEDYNKVVALCSWSARLDRRNGNYQAIGNQRNGRGGFRAVLMHRFVVNATKGKCVDHKSHDTLDNRKQNLRICLHRENLRNMKHHIGCSSRFKGVSFRLDSQKWRAYIGFNSKLIHLGSFSIESEAAKAYDRKARELFGAFALTNKKAGLL